MLLDPPVRLVMVKDQAREIPAIATLAGPTHQRAGGLCKRVQGVAVRVAQHLQGIVDAIGRGVIDRARLTKPGVQVPLLLFRNEARIEHVRDVGRGGTAQVYGPKPLGDLLAEGLPQEATVLILHPQGLGQDRGMHLLLAREEGGQGRRGRNGIRATTKNLVVSHNASDGRPVPRNQHRLWGHTSPLRAPVEEVELLIHGLDQGRMEQLPFTAGQLLGLGRPIADGPLVPAHQLRDRAGGIGIDGPDRHVRYPSKGGTTSRLQEKGTAEVFLRLQRLVLDGPVQPFLPGNRGAPM